MLPPMKARTAGPLLLGIGLALFAAFAVWFFVFLDAPTPRTSAEPGEVARPQPVDSPEDLPPEEEDEAPATWPDSAPRILLGQVSDPEGRPISGARVVVEHNGKVVTSGRSDAQGAYRVRDVPPRPSRIRAEATGFEPLVESRPKFPAGRDVRKDLVLRPIPGLRGLVVSAGSPVVGAQLTLHTEGTMRPTGFTRSDEGGRFFLPWPDDGATFLMARHNQHGFVREQVSGPGEVVIELPAGGFIEGRVVDQSGQGVERFSVSASPLVRGTGGAPAQSFEGSDGTFRLGPLAAGPLEVWAAAEGYQPAEKRGLELQEGETIQDLVFVLQASVELEGRVTDARTGQPVEGATVIPAEWKSGALAEMVGAETDADGRYHLSALPGVRTSIRVKAEGYRSVLIGGVEGRPGERIQRDFALTPQPENQRPASELTGVGAVLANHPDGVRIAELIAGGPAEAVLQAGDVIVAVDGEPVRGKEMGTVAQAVRGEEGSDVELMVLRNGSGDPEPVVLRRGRVTLPDRHHPRN